jgi:hypothetical protein
MCFEVTVCVVGKLAVVELAFEIVDSNNPEDKEKEHSD